MSMIDTRKWLQSYKSSNEADQNLCRVICITGGKGGVGKTTVALKFAMQLSQKYKTLLIDCDHNLSNTLIKLGLPLDSRNKNAFLSEDGPESNLYSFGNFNVICGANGDADLFKSTGTISEKVIGLIGHFSKTYRYIILDSPAGLNRDTMDLAAYSDDRIFVINPDKSSLTDSYSLIKILSNEYGVKLNQLVVNKTKSFTEYKKVIKSLYETTDTFLGCRTVSLGHIPYFFSKTNSFDNDVVNNSSSDLQQYFSKIVEKYTELLSDRVFYPHQLMAKDLEHDVQSRY